MTSNRWTLLIIVVIFSLLFSWGELVRKEAPKLVDQMFGSVVEQITKQ